MFLFTGEFMDNQIQIYQSEDGQVSLQVSLENETVWLNQSQMAMLFDTSSSRRKTPG